MKTKITALFLALCSFVVVLSGCSSSPYKLKNPYKYKNYSQFLKLGNYGAVEIKQSDIDAKILDKFHESAESTEEKVYSDVAKEEDKNALIERGDVAKIDFTGYLNGEKFDGGAGTDYDLTIGSGSFIDGFEEGLIGYGIGDEVSLDLRFPDPYPNNSDLAGKDVVFVVKIKTITRKIYPAYNDENVAEYTDFETVVAFEEEHIKTIHNDLVWKAFFSDCKVIKYPEKELRYYYNSTINSYTQSAAMYGVSLETYIGYMGYTSLSDFYNYIASQAKSNVKQELIVLTLVEEKTDLAMTDEVYEQKTRELWQEAIDNEEYSGSYKKFKKEYDRKNIEITLYYEIVIDFLKEGMIIIDDVTKNGLVTNRLGTKYYIDGVLQHGWHEIADADDNKKWHFFDEDTGYAYNGVYLMPERDGETNKYLEFGEKGVYLGLADGLKEDSKGKRFFVNGTLFTGLKELDLDEEIEGDEEYFFDPNNDGYMAVKPAYVYDEESDSDLFHDFDENGIHQGLFDGRYSDDKGVRYFDNGVLKTGWIELPDEDDEEVNNEYYLNPNNDGYMATGVNYVDKDGTAMYYEFDSTGKFIGPANGFFEDDKGLRYFINGVMATGEGQDLELDGKKGDYYFNTDTESEDYGYAHKGWLDIDGDDKYDFYYKDDYTKAVNEILTIDDNEYTFGSDGRIVTSSEEE